MSCVPTVSLGDVAEFVRGINFKPDDVVPVGTPESVACMRTKNVQSSLDLSDVWAVHESFMRREDQCLQEGDILVSSANSWNLVGKCSWIPALPYRATFGGFVSVLRASSSKLNRRYLYRWFSSEYVQETLRSFGQKTTNISNLNIGRCERLQLPLPPLEEQRRIAAILDQAETLRTQRHQALAHLDTLTQSLFLDMFGDPVANEMGWSELSLAAATSDIQIGPFGSLLHQEDYVPDGIPLINPMHIKDGKIFPGAEQAISKPKYDQLGLYQLRVGDLVMGRRGEMGRCAIVLEDDGPLMCGTGSLFIRPDNTKATADYLYAVLSSVRMKVRLEEFSLGATMPNLNKGIVAGLKLALPPLSLQQTFATRIQAIEALKATHRAALAQLDALFASLQQRAFAGEL